ncbi:MAG: LuxR C-terminal-related transcriptional regulator [Desulfobacterales bacterium]|nr:LuxR C-terminal-related transcriptional regulator [Desulfobacterales bacterium]
MEKQLKLQNDLVAALGTTHNFGQTLKNILDITLTVKGIDCGAIITFGNKNPEIGVQNGLSTEAIESLQHFLAEKSDLLSVLKPTDFNLNLNNGNNLKQLHPAGIFPVIHDGNFLAVIFLGSFSTKPLPLWIQSTLKNTCIHLGQIMNWLLIEKKLNAAKEQNEIAMQVANLGMWDWDLVKNRIYSDNRAREIVEFDPNLPDTWDQYVFEEDIKIIDEIDKAIMEGSNKKFIYNYRVRSKTGKVKWIIEIAKTIEWDNNGKPIKALGVVFDDTDRKELELERQEALGKLEKRVAERTMELEKAYSKLKDKSIDLEAANTALGVLINKREEDKKELEKNYNLNIQKHILPYIESLNRTSLSSEQKVYLGIINNNLNEIVSPFNRTLESRFNKLTPTELRVTNMIKHGNSTKEIAFAMKISAKTIENHRHSIRKKLKIHNKPINLHTYLLTLN